MDRRQRKTRQAVFQAFTRLLAVKSYASITVQEIIDEADIGRSTFYSHFETKDDLLKELCSEIFRHVFSDDLTKERTHDFSGSSGDIRMEITHILYHLQENRSYLRGILSCESGEIFMGYFKEHLRVAFGKFLQDKDAGDRLTPATAADKTANLPPHALSPAESSEQKRGKDTSTVPRDYVLDHMVWDFAETVRWWMQHEEYTPEEIGNFYCACW